MTKNFRFKIILSGLSIISVISAQIAIPKLFDLILTKNLIIVLISAVLVIFFTNFRNKRKLANNAFFLILFIGTAISLVRPVQYTLDEDSHLKHTIGLSDSLLFKYSKEEIVDYDLVFEHDGIRNQANYQGDEYWYNVNHRPTKVKGEIIGFDNPAFLPGAVGWNLGRFLSDKVYISYYIGRIFNVIAYALLVFLAIKISKVYQFVIYLIGVLPSAVYVISGFHYDYLYYGASLIFLGILTNILAGKEKITALSGTMLQVISLLFAFSKFPMILVGSVIFSLPSRYYIKNTARLISIISFVVMLTISFIYTGIIRVISNVESVTGDSPGLVYFFTHPLPIMRTVLDIPHVIIDNFVSRPLQYVTHQSSLLIALNLVFFIILLFICSMQWKYELPIIFQIYTLMLFLGIALLMIFAITGDPRAYNKGDILVGGVQGRYYYFMMATIPIFLGYWLNRNFRINSFNEDEERRFISILQYILVFLNIFTLSVGMYTQL